MSTSYPRQWFARRVSVPKRTPSRMAAPLPTVDRSLRLSEWLFFAVLVLAYVESIAQPLFGVQLHLSVFAHLPLFLAGPVLILHLIGVAFNQPAFPWQRTFRAAWPLLLLALFALVGSAVAKWELNVTESYLAFGIYLALLPLYMVLGADASRARAWASWLVFLALMVSLAAVAGEAARYRTFGTSLHEIQFIVISGFFALYYATASRAAKFSVVVAIILIAALNQKLTGFLVAGLAILHFAVIAGWRRVDRQWRPAYAIAAFVGVTVFVAVAGLLYVEYRQFLPSGNPEVRLQQYDAALRQFYESPLWGNAYLRSSGEIYSDNFRQYYIPTHGDVLDMLKHGGLIAFTLFLLGYWKIFSLIHRAVKATRDDRMLNAYFTAARFFQVAALVTFTFNPLLLKGPLLLVIWANLGLAAGMAIGILGRPARQAV